jgi:Flp pilus assembly protein TadG
MMKQKRKGQTLLEFVVLFIVLVAAFLAMQNYLRRGVQGKWKENLDSMGKQYDPAANAQTTYSMESNATTEINVINEVGGYRTWRTDTMNMTEDKDEYIKINGI